DRPEAAGGRRADGRPRREKRRGDPRPHGAFELRIQEDDRHRDPRPEGRVPRAPPRSPRQGRAQGRRPCRAREGRRHGRRGVGLLDLRPEPSMKLLPLILKNAFRKKTRTLLTIGSIVLPLLVICLMGTFLKALEAPDPKTTRGSFRLVMRHRVSLMTSLPTAYEEKVRQLPGVEAVSDFNFFFGRY